MKNCFPIYPHGALLRCSIVPLALLGVVCSHAQVSTAPRLPEVVVTATRSSQLLSATLAHTTVITRAEIDRSQATDLVTLLQREAGLQLTQNGGIGSAATIFMRGAPSLQTLLLIDGIPQTRQDASGSVGLEHVMLDNVERVEIVRGNVSAIYGSGAIGGVIQVFTRSGDGTPSVRLSADAGPRDYRRLSAAASAKAGDTSFSVSVSRVTTDGFSAVDTTRQSLANPDADGYQNTSVNAAVKHNLDKDHNFGVRLSRSEGASDYDNSFGAPTDRQFSRNRLGDVSLFTDNRWGNWRSRLSLGEHSDKSRFVDDGVFGSTDSFNTHATVLNWVNTIALGDDWHFPSPD